MDFEEGGDLWGSAKRDVHGVPIAGPRSSEKFTNVWDQTLYKNLNPLIIRPSRYAFTASWDDLCATFPIIWEPVVEEASIKRACDLTFERLKETPTSCTLVVEEGSIKRACDLTFERLKETTARCTLINFPAFSSESEDVTQVFKDMGKHELFLYEDIIFHKIGTLLSHKIIPEFWNCFAVDVMSDFAGFRAFQDAVNNLYTNLSVFSKTLDILELLREHMGAIRVLFGETTLTAALMVCVRATLHSQLPLNHSFITEQFYRIAFNAFCHSDIQLITTMDTDLLQCDGCNQELDSCECADIILVFNDINIKLIELDVLERLAGEVITSLIHTKIEHYVADTCKGSFDKSYINTLEAWLETQVMQWLGRVFVAGPAAAVQRFKQKLSHFLYETYTRTRIDQLFNIIIEYPDSQPAVEDLRVCLMKTDLRSYLIQTVRSALETRLLHPGVNTTDVLTAYIAAIRSLRQLDPSGVLLEMVTQPVRHYLRQRDDTVRYVVTSLTEDGPSDLAEELSRAEELVDDGSPEDEGGVNWETWMPDPMDADPATMSRSRRTSDIISMLVTIYGSKDLFVNEYRTLLADRLLTHLTFDTEKEIRYLELLKIRFGESQLHYCEVMLKDVFDSKRINAHLHSDINLYNLKTEGVVTSALILSAQFWPPFKDEKLEIPPFIKEYLEIYTKAFETLKGNRTLCWKPHLGNVVMEIELKDRKICVSVSPIHATILWLFQDKNQWTIEELSQMTLVTATVLRRKIAYWQSQGILREISTDTFLLVEENPLRSKHHNPVDVCDEDEAESAMASAQDQREEELQVFWSYIVGMLTNLDSLPLERIHQMLKMFASQGECSLQELRHFLERKVRDHELLFSGGLYRLPKP